jgi:hypothetical protein
MLALILVDVFWLIIIMPYWRTKLSSPNLYWESLSGVHTFVLILAFLELFLKLSIVGLIFLEYKSTYPNDVSEIFKFSYTGPGSLSKFNLTSEMDDKNKNKIPQ